MFESSVNLDGTKTRPFKEALIGAFESSVNLDGTKTCGGAQNRRRVFESSVNSDGLKHHLTLRRSTVRLRVV